MRTGPTRLVRYACVLGAAACVPNNGWRSVPVATSTLQAHVVAAAVDAAGELVVLVSVVDDGAEPLVVAPRDSVAYHASGPHVPLDTTRALAAPVVLAPGASEEIQLVFHAAERPWQQAPVFVVLASDTGRAAVNAPPLRIDWQ